MARELFSMKYFSKIFVHNFLCLFSLWYFLIFEFEFVFFSSVKLCVTVKQTLINKTRCYWNFSITIDIRRYTGVIIGRWYTNLIANSKYLQPRNHDHAHRWSPQYRPQHNPSSNGDFKNYQNGILWKFNHRNTNTMASLTNSFLMNKMVCFIKSIFLWLWRQSVEKMV